MSYTTEREIAVRTVLQASLLCRSIQAELVSEETVTKKDKSPVTVADFTAQTLICIDLAMHFPNDPIVAEESSEDLVALGAGPLKESVFNYVRSIHEGMSDEDSLSALGRGGYSGGGEGRFWTIDPIDGTKGFLRNQQYAISLSLIEDGNVVLGVLGCPNYPHSFDDPDAGLGMLFIAEKGQGAFSRTLDDEVETQIKVADISDPADAVFCESVESGHSSHGHSQQIADRLGVKHPSLRIDSQCKYAAVGQNSASVYLRLPTRADYEEKIWDHAAGWMVLQEAGGTCTDVYGKPLNFSLGRTLKENKGVIVTGGSIHEQVVNVTMDVLGIQ